MRNSALAFLCCALPAAAQVPERYKDTAGTYLAQVIETVRKEYPDAELIGISGRSDITGSALCDPKNPTADGWVYHFYSKRGDTAAMVAGCQGYIVGPLKEYVQTAKDTPVITGRFTDNDEAMRDLANLGVSLEPADHGVKGRRPFGFTLVHAEDDRYQESPIFWQITIGGDVYMMNAISHKVEKDVVVRYARLPDGTPDKAPRIDPAKQAGQGASAAFKAPPRRTKPKGYTAFRDLGKARAYAKRKLPGAALMGIDGIADAWGQIDCLGAGDGWAFYFYWPRSKTIESVYACKGQVGQGQSGYIPVSLTQHRQLPEGVPGLDSDVVMDGLLVDRSSILNEGMGRYYTRRAPMRLFQFKSSPLTSPDLWNKTLLWEVSVGRSVYYIDAQTGKFVAEKK